MEEFTDCTESQQNTQLLFVNHEHNNKNSKVGEQNVLLEQATNWPTAVGGGVDRHSEAAVVHNWVAAAAAVMHATHLNNSNNNNNVQHCDNMSENVAQYESSQDVLTGWGKKPATQNPWTEIEKKSGNAEMQRNGEVCLDALNKLANLVIHDAPQSPTANTVSGACCLAYNDSDLEDDEQNFAKLCAAAHQTETSELLLLSEETGAVAGCAETHSNRTSINNSTENLSYSSDNLYANDLLMLDDNAEEISLNSDDCIYAYRGDGTDFDLTLDDVLNKRLIGGLGAQADIAHNAVAADDETEFLEMDFDPDPLSEADIADMAANTFLLQRNSCHSTSLMRQHFSSPTEERAIQEQSLQHKNFDCINLHLDQINETLCVEENARTLAKSLPNTLHEHFKSSTLNNTNSAEQMHVSNKLTGAKPKRSANLALKNPTANKSRCSRSAMGTNYACSNSFDERSLSCNGFMSNALENIAPPNLDYLISTPLVGVTEHNSDEACLDCLEREFLANTIGKVLDPQKECSKCRKRSSSSVTLYETADRRAQQCRSSGSSNSFLFEYTTQLSDSCLFGASSEFLCEASDLTTQGGDTHWTAALKAVKPLKSDLDQRENNTDLGEKLLKNLLLTERKTATLPTVNLSEDTLTKAMNKLNINYNQEMLRPYFTRYNKNSEISGTSEEKERKFKNLKEFLLHESKRNGNFAELKRLIEAASKQQITVRFQKIKGVNSTEEQVPVKVCDILQQWTRNKDLSVLLELDKRYAEANVLGKIAYIIRQTEQRFGTTMRRPLPEFITIPQYYATGEIILTKNY